LKLIFDMLTSRASKM